MFQPGTVFASCNAIEPYPSGLRWNGTLLSIMANRLPFVQRMLADIQAAKAISPSPWVEWLERAAYQRLLDLSDVVQFALPRPSRDPARRYLKSGSVYYAGYDLNTNIIVLATHALDDWQAAQLDVVLSIPRRKAEDFFTQCTVCFVAVRMVDVPNVEARLLVHQGKLRSLGDWREGQELPPEALGEIISEAIK